MSDQPHVLCVDDEPKVLEGLTLSLRCDFRVSSARNGQSGLAIVDGDPPSVVVSDMRMPEMDGASFLSQVKERSPETVRILLTGYGDLDSAIAAVNHGQVFRFLTKPCSSQVFLSAVHAAAEQHRLITAEKELLEKTLLGSVKALTEILSLANPLAFGRAIRLKQHASELVAALRLPLSWQIEVATMMSQIGCMALPAATNEKLYYGKPLSKEEVEMTKQLPTLAVQLLGSIPRLDAVRAILLAQQYDYTGAGTPGGLPKGEAIPLGARVLKLVSDYDSLEAAEVDPMRAIAVLQVHSSRYDPTLLEALARVKTQSATGGSRELALAAVRPGIFLARDVTSTTGALLIPRGHEVTQGLLQRLRSFPSGTIREPIAVFAPSESHQPNERARSVDENRDNSL
jgi:response regulator RpfG family c-di-GMP phosphodiesterase